MGWPTVEVLELRAEVLHATGKQAMAVQQIHSYAREKGAQLDRAAALLERFGLTEQAEKLWRTHAAESREPTSVLLLALHLSRRGRVAEALDLCEGAWKKCPPEKVAYASVGVLRAVKSTPAQQRRVEAWLDAAQRSAPHSVPLSLYRASFQESCGDYNGAVASYQRLLARAPRNVPALNNLACLLALMGKGPVEALGTIQMAIDEAGPLAELLDTRAVVYLRMGQGDRAVTDLLQAVALAPSAAKYLHLAQAYLLAGDRRAARAAERQSRAKQLREADLHPLERKSLMLIAKQLDGK
jgi:tetratricopeptide (TPR) repeat protein